MYSENGCQFVGCREAGVACEFEHRRGERDFVWYLQTYPLLEALRLVWSLWRTGTAVDTIHYCEAHCRVLGFCYGCGKHEPVIWGYDRALADAGLCMSCFSRLWRPGMVDGTAVATIVIRPWMGTEEDEVELGDGWLEFDDLHARAEEIAAEEESLAAFVEFVNGLEGFD